MYRFITISITIYFGNYTLMAELLLYCLRNYKNNFNLLRFAYLFDMLYRGDTTHTALITSLFVSRQLISNEVPIDQVVQKGIHIIRSAHTISKALQIGNTHSPGKKHANNGIVSLIIYNK